MNQLAWPANIKYAARIANVREVTLQGTAALVFWQRLLDREGTDSIQTSGTGAVVVERHRAGLERFSVPRIHCRGRNH